MRMEEFANIPMSFVGPMRIGGSVGEYEVPLALLRRHYGRRLISARVSRIRKRHSMHVG